MLNVFLVGAGGFLGAVARYCLSGWVQIRLYRSGKEGGFVLPG